MKKTFITIGHGPIRVTIFGLMIFVSLCIWYFKLGDDMTRSNQTLQKCQESIKLFMNQPEKASLKLHDCLKKENHPSLRLVQLHLLYKLGDINTFWEVWEIYYPEILKQKDSEVLIQKLWKSEEFLEYLPILWAQLESQDMIHLPAWAWKLSEFKKESASAALLHAEEMVNLWPKSQWVLTETIKIAYELEQHEKALEYLTQLKRIAPNLQNASLTDFLAKEIKEKNTLDAIESNNFLLRFQGEGDLTLAENLLEQLEIHYSVLLGKSGISLEKKLQVILFKDLEFGGEAALMPFVEASFDGKIRLPIKSVIDQKNMSKLLRHELVHAMLEAKCHGDVPFWLNEGLAQWLDGSRVTNEHNFVNITQDGLYKPFLQRTNPSIIRQYYQASLYLTQALIEEYSIGEVFTYIERLSEQEEDAFTATFTVEESSWIGKKLAESQI
jgi:hypothetical protein